MTTAYFVTNEMNAVTRRIGELTDQLGDEIVKANMLGLAVSLEVDFNNGSESMLHHRLSGDLDVSVALAIELPTDAAGAAGAILEAREELLAALAALDAKEAK